ncbi:ATP-binding protein [Mucilaginibacter calamicampi]|uniref:ATP-binding protein n=1 Tax=Mucilaginibacter calamicampi TaxID=1302352 RepID=A0ABW2YTH9_9SPHI
MKNLSKICLSALFAVAAVTASAQHKVEKLWETEPLIKVPESALFTKSGIYVSIIDGQPWEADGKGGIGKVGANGKIINADWITGLNAPKGMAIVGDLLYVADIHDVVAISISKGKIDHKIAVPESGGFNDVTADKNGTVWVTDSQKGAIYKVQGKTATLFMDNLRGINGIKAIDDKLYVLTGKEMFVTDASKNKTTIVALEQGGDGIEPVGNGDFIVTAWSGYMYYVNTAKGTKDLLLDTHTGNSKTADIGYDPATKTIYVPTFSANSIAAYKLQ